MKILKQGVLPGDILYISTCNYCKTVFEFTKSEAKLSSCQRDGSWLTIDCPLCKKSVIRNI